MPAQHPPGVSISREGLHQLAMNSQAVSVNQLRHIDRRLRGELSDGSSSAAGFYERFLLPKRSRGRNGSHWASRIDHNPSRRQRCDLERRIIFCKQHISIASRRRCRPMTFMMPFATSHSLCSATTGAIRCYFSAWPIGRGSSTAIHVSRQAIAGRRSPQRRRLLSAR